MAAGKAIRERDKTGSIYMISNEEYPAYNRPMLTKSLVAGLDADQIAIQDASWYEEQNICQILGKEVVSVDTKEKEIHTSDGAKFRYDSLIYALGAESFVPPIPGSDLPEVAVIRRLSDTKKVAELLEKTTDAVVIGGGVLGLEAAWELKKARCRVTVLELAPRLMSRQLDEGAGKMLESIGQAQGIEIRTGVTIEAIEGEGRVAGVRLGGGEVIPAQLVIVSCGVRANTKIAEEAGIFAERSVVVDSRMQTNVEGIFACGDCAQYEGHNYAIWPQAVEEGKNAGANAAGEALEYLPSPAALTFHGMSTALFAIGDNGSNPNLIYRTVEFQDVSRKQYEKYYFRNNRLCGVILIGDTGKMAELSEAVARRASFGELFGK